MAATQVGRPETKYVETPLGYLAYQTFGRGPRDIMFVSGALKNSDVLRDEPSAVRFFDRLGRLGRVIHYDMRGSGVSDPIPGGSKWMTIEDGALAEWREGMESAPASGSQRQSVG